MIKLRHSYVRERDRQLSEVGSREKIVYSSRNDKQGNIELVPVRKENMYDYVQSFKESCDINNVIKRYQAGDTTALAQRQGMYGDFTVLPTSYADLLNKINEGQEVFEQLPLDERAKYDFNFTKFMMSFDKPQEVVAEPQPIKMNEEVRLEDEQKHE